MCIRFNPKASTLSYALKPAQEMPVVPRLHLLPRGGLTFKCGRGGAPAMVQASVEMETKRDSFESSETLL